MLADAVAAEGYKFLRNRGPLFWGFFFTPLGMLLFNTGVETYLKFRSIGITPAAPANLEQQIIGAIAEGGSSFLQVFFVAGAAAIFAGEYRWETWRLVTPRNSRINLLAAKFIVYAIACAASLTAMALAAALYGLYGAALNGVTPMALSAAFPARALGVFLATWAELLVLGAFTALIAVASRAMMGALMAGIFFSFAQSIAMALVHPWEAPLRYFALVPDMSAYLIRAWASGQEIAPGMFADPAKILPAAGFLGGWILLVGGAALGLFQTQDLPRE